MCRTHCGLVLMALLVGSAQSWDLAVTAGDRIEFYTNGTKTDTVQFDSQNLTAIAYDEIHDLLLYVDKQSGNDAICGHNVFSKIHKCFVERSGRNIQGLAFDPITETLFFTDTKERSVNWISAKLGSENNVNGNLLFNMANGFPTDIAVDSCRGYIYWINANLTRSTIERARFDGSEREVIINSTYNCDLHSLAVGQQTQKVYWIMPENGLKNHLCSADLNGKNKKSLIDYTYTKGDKMFNHPNALTISKTHLYMASWCSSCSSLPLWRFPKPSIQTSDYRSLFTVQPTSPLGIAAKYKISEQIEGIGACTALTSPRPNNRKTCEIFGITREHVEPFCVHNIKVDGESLCKCTPGYLGERCDVSVCLNHCLHGNCTVNEEGLPKCSCNAGYTGDRCEINACHGYCFNNGTCSVNEEDEPMCRCKVDYAGDRCEIADCLNYCLHGICSFNEEGTPVCRCNAGYSGVRCEVNVCHGYCLNNGTCSLMEDNKPVCECNEEYGIGDRCETLGCQCSEHEESSSCRADESIASNSAANSNLTLADLFANWRKPVSKIVIVEINPN